MIHLDIKVVERYYEAKAAMKDAKKNYIDNPCQLTYDAYELALAIFHDICVGELANLVGDKELSFVEE